MASQALLKRWIKRLLPHSAQLRLRRYVLARKVARGRAGAEEDLAAIRPFVRPGDVVLDIGANAGAIAVELGRLVGPQGRVFAFEPIPDTYHVLIDAIRLAGLSNVRTFPLGIGDRTGRVAFTIPETEGFAGFYQAHVASERDEGPQLMLQLERLDDLLVRGEILPPTFIKCDVEGHELAVLRGAEALLQEHRPNWYLEVSRATSGDVFACLRGHGYLGFMLESGGPARTDRYLEGRSSNYLFLHPGNPRTAAAGLSPALPRA